MKEINTNILGLTLAELEADMAALGQPRFRARQVYRWLFRSFQIDFAQMANLPAALRATLAERFASPLPEVAAEQASVDGLTTKVLLSLADGQRIESVLMRQRAAEEERRSVCVSSQVGCPVGCVFCATGQGGFLRNLTAGEIVGQVLHFATTLAREGLTRPIDSVVFMGQGEPLLNLAAVRQAVAVLNEPEGLNLGARHLTISTCGVVPGIAAVAGWPYQVGLAVSLHAPDDDLRSRLVPLNRKYPLREVLDACWEYTAKTGRRVTFEYTLIDDVNDRPEQGRALAALLAGQLAHVNLIPLNATPGASLAPSGRGRVLAFQSQLQAAGVACTVRVERGADIDAACGQLRRRHAGSKTAARA